MDSIAKILLRRTRASDTAPPRPASGEAHGAKMPAARKAAAKPAAKAKPAARKPAAAAKAAPKRGR
jgi:DNA-binding protein HU-beta